MAPTTRFYSSNLPTPEEQVFAEVEQREWVMESLNMIYTLHGLDGHRVQIFYSPQVNWGVIQRQK